MDRKIDLTRNRDFLKITKVLFSRHIPWNDQKMSCIFFSTREETCERCGKFIIQYPWDDITGLCRDCAIAVKEDISETEYFPDNSMKTMDIFREEW